MPSRLTLTLALASLVACSTPAAPPPPAPVVDFAAALEADVRHVVSAFAPRDGGHPENLDRLAQWISARFVKAGGVVKDQVFEVDGARYRNVIATFGPADGERLIVGAHYDSAGPRPGADDNASGVAVLLGLAERLGEKAPAKTVELVAWTLEEPPWFATDNMGSVVHARATAVSGVKVMGVVSLETLGFYRDAAGTQRFPDPRLADQFGTRGDFVAIVGRPEDAALMKRIAPAFRGLIRAEVLAAPAKLEGVAFSDHRSYWPHGMTAVMLTDTAFFRNERYHTMDDTPDTLDYPRLAKVADGVERAVRSLIEAP